MDLEENIKISKILKSKKFRPKDDDKELCEDVAAILGTFPIQDREEYLKFLEPIFQKKKLSLRAELNNFLREVDELYNKVIRREI